MVIFFGQAQSAFVSTLSEHGGIYIDFFYTFLLIFIGDICGMFFLKVIKVITEHDKLSKKANNFIKRRFLPEGQKNSPLKT